MANIKFYRKGNYIIIEDSADSKYYEEHAEKVYVKKATLAATDYYITIGDKRWLAQPITEIQDEAGSVYAAADFESVYSSVASSGAVVSTQAPTVTSTEILASDGRLGASFVNLTSADCYILLGNGTASSTNYTVKLSTGVNSIYELPYNYSGAVQAVFSGTGTGNLVITKLV